MLAKLMKFEFRATGRVFLPLFAALIVISALSRAFIKLSFTLPSGIAIAISTLLMVSIGVITFILTLQRFYRNLLGDEGYLMFTLPVRTDSLIWSKLLVSTIWFIVSGVMVLIAIIIMGYGDMNFNLGEFFRSLPGMLSGFNGLRIEQVHIVLYVIEIFVICILGLFSGILMLYASMSVSILFNSHRGLAGFGAFVVFQIIGQTIIGNIISSKVVERFLSSITVFNAYAQLHIAFCIAILSELIVGALLYMITRYILNHRLNLE